MNHARRIINFPNKLRNGGIIYSSSTWADLKGEWVCPYGHVYHYGRTVSQHVILTSCSRNLIHNLRTTWRWLVSLTPRPLYPSDRLTRRLGESLKSQSGCYGRQKILARIRNRTTIPRSSSRQPNKYLTAWILADSQSVLRKYSLPSLLQHSYQPFQIYQTNE